MFPISPLAKSQLTLQGKSPGGMELKVKAKTQGLISGAEIKTEGGVTKTSFITPLELARILGMVAWCHPRDSGCGFPQGECAEDTGHWLPFPKHQGKGAETP